MGASRAGSSPRAVSAGASATHRPRAANHPQAGDQHVSCLVALIADTALEEVNPCRAVDVVVELDSERLSVVGRRMRAVGQDTTPILGPHTVESDGLFLHLV